MASTEQREAPEDNEATAAFTPLAADEVNKYTTGRMLISALGLRTLYHESLQNRFERYVISASEVARELEPGRADLHTKIREAIFRIGGYQTWSDIQRSMDVVGKATAFVFTIATLSTVSGAVFYADGPFWHRVLYALITWVSACVVIVIAMLASEIRTPTSPTARALLGSLGLSAFMMAGWLLSRWQSTWGTGMSSGVVIGAVSLFALGILFHIGRALVHRAYHVSWTRWTDDEIIETLASLHWSLNNEPEPHCLKLAASELEHVATCIERFLPRYLNRYLGPDSISLLRRSHGDFAEIAAGARALANECLLPKKTTRTSTSDKLARLLVAAAQGRWGEWERGQPDVTERSTRWWSWISGILRFSLAVLPIVLVALAALYLHQTDPRSPLLKAEVLAPVLVATFGFFTTVLTSGLTAGAKKTDDHGTSFRIRHKP